MGVTANPSRCWQNQRRHWVLAQEKCGGHSPTLLWQQSLQDLCFKCISGIRRFQPLQQNEKFSTYGEVSLHPSWSWPRDDKSHHEHLKRPFQCKAKHTESILLLPWQQLGVTFAAAGQLWSSTLNFSAGRNKEVQVDNRKLLERNAGNCCHGLSLAETLWKSLKTLALGMAAFGCSSASSLTGS